MARKIGSKLSNGAPSFNNCVVNINVHRDDCANGVVGCTISSLYWFAVFCVDKTVSMKGQVNSFKPLQKITTKTVRMKLYSLAVTHGFEHLRNIEVP
ncbi:MAG: hypothetical protein GY696_37185 [Gammaproteobacteria bacterium]|nr:hypothetical protein [Gammaproteobacteria bacterium]